MNCVQILGLGLVLSAPTAKVPSKDGAPGSLVGEWVCAKVVSNGKELAGERASLIRYEFAADGKVRLHVEGDAEGTYTTDPKKDPWEMDILLGGGKTTRLIYKFEGESLVICLKKSGDRPAKFESKPGTNEILMTLMRKDRKRE